MCPVMGTSPHLTIAAFPEDAQSPSVLLEARYGATPPTRALAPNTHPAESCCQLQRLRSKAREGRDITVPGGPACWKRWGLFKGQMVLCTCHEVWPSAPASETSLSSHSGAAAERHRCQDGISRLTSSPGRRKVGGGPLRGRHQLSWVIQAENKPEVTLGHHHIPPPPWPAVAHCSQPGALSSVQ